MTVQIGPKAKFAAVFKQLVMTGFGTKTIWITKKCGTEINVKEVKVTKIQSTVYS